MALATAAGSRPDLLKNLLPALEHCVRTLDEAGLAQRLAQGPRLGPDVRLPNGQTLLGLMVTDSQAVAPEKRRRMVDLLLDAGEDPLALAATGIAWPDRDTPWFHLMTERDPSLALHVLQRCPDLVARGEALDRSPLCVALFQHHADLAEGLLDAGASPHLAWPKGVGQRFMTDRETLLNPVWLAAVDQQAPVLDRLLAAGASTGRPRGNTGLYTLVVERNAEKVLEVLERHAVPMTDQERHDVVPDAILRNVPWRTIERLIARGADPLAFSPRFGSALQAAVSSSMFYPYVEPLLALGADPESGFLLNASILATVRQRPGPQDQALARRLEQAVLDQEARRAHPSGEPATRGPSRARL